jgi:hypothetical protein
LQALDLKLIALTPRPLDLLADRYEAPSATAFVFALCATNCDSNPATAFVLAAIYVNLRTAQLALARMGQSVIIESSTTQSLAKVRGVDKLHLTRVETTLLTPFPIFAILKYYKLAAETWDPGLSKLTGSLADRWAKLAATYIVRP